MNQIEKTVKTYAAGKPEIAAAFLFGSETAGRSHRESDIDIAFLLKPDCPPSAEFIMEISDKLTSLLQREADIVNLNSSSPIIRMQVLKKGKRIFTRDQQIYNDFFVRTINEYDDLKRIRSIIEKKILKGRIYG